MCQVIIYNPRSMIALFLTGEHGAKLSKQFLIVPWIIMTRVHDFNKKNVGVAFM